MKKILILLLLVSLILVSCNDNPNNLNGNNNTANAENNEVTENVNNAEVENTENNVTDVNNTTDEETTEETTEEITEDTSDEVVDDGLPTRDMIPDPYKWDLQKVYASTEEFMADVTKVEASFDQFTSYEDKMLSSYANFKEVLELYERIRRITDKIYVFATLQAHTDTNNSDFSDLEDIAAELDTNLGEYTAYFLPTIANADPQLLKSYLANDEMADFIPYVNEIIRERDHILSVDEEELLAQAQVLFEVPESIYDAYNYLTDLSEVLPQPNWDLFWNGTRDDKRKAMEAYYAKNAIGNDLIAEIYESEIKKNTFFAKARNFDSALDDALDTDGVPMETYELIFKITHDNLDKLHKWVSMKKEILQLEDQFYLYDQYTPLIDNPYSFVDFENGKEIIYKALAPLGDAYVRDVKSGFNSRWADVFTTKGKYEGGYQWGTYDTDPFILLNFNGFMTDVSTAAHEMGHALNFKYSNAAQGYFSASVPIFNAEVASTTNEALVFEYRIANAQNVNEKQQALLNYIELIENTIFTQMIFAEFEKQAYETYEAGTPISADVFNEMMADILVMYYGEDYGLTDMAARQWSEIPHFYNAYYVYKYATGLSAGLNFADNILNGSEKDVQRYLNYLSAGSSDDSLVLLKNAGVDFSTGQPLQKAYDRFEELIDEFYDTLK